MSKQGEKESVFVTTKVRTKLKGDGSWLQCSSGAQAEADKEKPWLAEVRAGRVNGAPVDSSPVSSPTPSTAPPTKSDAERGIFTKLDKPPSSSTTNGVIPSTTQFTKKSSESYKKIAPYTVRPTSENQESQLSNEEQEKRTEAASNVLKKSSMRKRSYVLSAAKKYESQEEMPETSLVNSSPAFVARRVEVTDVDGSAATPAAASARPPSPASTPEPKPRKVVDSIKTAAAVAPKVEEPVKDDPPPVSVTVKDPFEEVEPGGTKLATPLPVRIPKCFQAVSTEPEPQDSDTSGPVDAPLVEVGPASAAPLPPTPAAPAPLSPALLSPAPLSPALLSPALLSPALLSPAPLSPALLSPAPLSPAPLSPAPLSPALLSPAPLSPAPLSPALLSPAPLSPALLSPAPLSPAPLSPALLSPALLSPAPLSPAPLSPALLSPAPLSPAPLSPALLSPAPLSPVPLSPAPLSPVPLSPAPLSPAPLPPALLSPVPLSPAPLSPALLSPAPLPPALLSPAPLSPAPLSPAPLSPAPLSPAPLSPAPLSPAPLSPALLSPALLSPAPLSPAPLSPAPVSAVTEFPGWTQPEAERAPKPSQRQSSSVDTLATLSDTLIAFDSSSTSFWDDEPEEDAASAKMQSTQNGVEQELSSCVTDDLLALTDGPEESADPAPPSPGRWSQDLLSGLSESIPAKTSGALDLLADDVIPIKTEARSSLNMQREENQRDETQSLTETVTTTTKTGTMTDTDREDTANPWSSREATAASSSADPFDPYPIGTPSSNSAADLLQPLSDVSGNSASFTFMENKEPSPDNVLESLADSVLPINTDTTSLGTGRSWARSWGSSPLEPAAAAESQGGPTVDPETLVMFERKSSENDSPWDRWTSPTVYTLATGEEEEEEEEESYEPDSRTGEEPRVQTPEPEAKKGFVYLKEYVNATELSLHNARDSTENGSDYLTLSPASYSYSSPSTYSSDLLSSTCNFCQKPVGHDAKITVEHLDINCHPDCFKVLPRLWHLSDDTKSWRNAVCVGSPWETFWTACSSMGGRSTARRATATPWTDPPRGLHPPFMVISI
ncbi:zinc finger protein 185 isoform X2 [Pseudoliparis swirei]|uniref:zinc finger protein 185 isoform X2 n=1 Tax=Pseudoliparis swirei TaxID=2059687 RepID=UPI0024BE804F|nr:zinc finger protein 185 isoform X2 [Pseudoliparis swirei]